MQIQGKIMFVKSTKEYTLIFNGVYISIDNIQFLQFKHYNKFCELREILDKPEYKVYEIIQITNNK